MRKKVVVPILLLMIGSFAVIPFFTNYASANFPENFDTYRSGVLNPGFWKFITNSTSCFPNSGGQPSSTYNQGNPASPPNTYLFNTGASSPGNCVAGHNYANIHQWFNASVPAVAVTLYVHDVSFGSTPAAGNINFFINQTSYNGNSVYANTNSNFTDTHAITSAYKKFISVVPALPGNNVTIAIGFATILGGSFPIASPAAWEIDNVTIAGANQIYTPHNFAMINTSSFQWFSIASFASSRVLLNYSSGSNDSAQWAPNGVIAPDINYANLGTAKLVTVYVGNIYSRSLIPSAHTMFYLDNPASVIAYSVAVTGPPEAYGPKSIYIVQQGGKNITSGYLDSSAKFSPSLIPGNYVVIVTTQNQSNTQIQTINFPATASSLTYNAYAGFSIKSTAGVVSAIGWQAGWNGTTAPKGIVVQYVDNLSSTCGGNNIGIEIKRTNGTGSYLVFSSYYTASGCGSPGGQAFAVTIPAANNNMNWTLSNQLVVFLNATNFFGTHYSLGSQGLACFGCLLLNSPNLPTDTLGLGNLLPNLTWLNLLSLAMIVMTGAGFGVYWSRFGFFAVALEVMFFAFAGWLAVSASATIAFSIGIVFIVLSFIGLMVFHEKT